MCEGEGTRNDSICDHLVEDHFVTTAVVITAEIDDKGCEFNLSYRGSLYEAFGIVSKAYEDLRRMVMSGS